MTSRLEFNKKGCALINERLQILREKLNHSQANDEKAKQLLSISYFGNSCQTCQKKVLGFRTHCYSCWSCSKCHCMGGVAYRGTLCYTCWTCDTCHKGIHGAYYQGQCFDCWKCRQCHTKGFKVIGHMGDGLCSFCYTYMRD